jgi:hypothetical protein
MSAIAWRQRNSPQSVERSVACSSLPAQERTELSGCAFGAIRPDVTSTNRFAAHDEGSRPAGIGLLAIVARNP